MVHCIDAATRSGVQEIPWVDWLLITPRRKAVTPALDVVGYMVRALLVLASLLQLNISACDHQQN
jgi:hypothetical protein